LLEKAIDFSIANRATLVQCLLLTDAGPEAALLRRAGFQHLADLLYLSSAQEQFPDSQPTRELQFVPISNFEPSRLAMILERTYEQTCDCPALNGMRSRDDVLDGYRAVGRFRPDLWLIAQSCNEDVGCLLLADHAPEPIWELVYMGIVPEARGRGLGLEMARYAQWLARRENVARLVLAVDAANEPAVAMYAAAGIASWDRRSVFMRLLHTPSKPA
jgi:ribosomal protein S18 acetylase RimI-like enzyme